MGTHKWTLTEHFGPAQKVFLLHAIMNALSNQSVSVTCIIIIPVSTRCKRKSELVLPKRKLRVFI
jgi:hypothetical protein